MSKRLILLACIVTILGIVSARAVENYKTSNFGGANQIWFEVEDFDERDPDNDSHFALVDEDGAFGRAINSIGTSGGAMIRWTFDIGKAGGTGGTWYFWGRVINPEDRSSYMLVEGADTIPSKPWPGGEGAMDNDFRIFENDTGPPWGWTSHDGGDEAHTKELQDGENTMYVFSRQQGALWDVFMWTDDPDYVPTDEDYINAETYTDPELASNPSPVGTDVCPGVVLNWTPGAYVDGDETGANDHRIDFSEDFNDVNDGTGGVIQDVSTYTPPAALSITARLTTGG